MNYFIYTEVSYINIKSFRKLKKKNTILHCMTTPSANDPIIDHLVKKLPIHLKPSLIDN